MSKKQIENNNAPFVQPNEQLDQEETKYTVARVPFYKRLFAAVIDLCFFLLVSFGLLTLCYFTVFNALGYHEKISQIHQLYAESGLYVKNEAGEFLTYLDVYDENKSPMANLDEPITYFYSHDQRAILDNKLEFYNNEKIKSGFFVYDGDEIVAKEGVKYDDIRPFLEEQFDSAVYYFKSNPIYLNNSTFTYYTLIFTILIIVVLSSSGFYLVVPLISKFGVTFGQMIFKFALIDKEKNIRASKKKVVFRYLSFATINIFAPVLLYTRVPYLSLIPLFISILWMAFNKNNFAPHDYISNTYLGLKLSLLNQEKHGSIYRHKSDYSLPRIDDPAQ